MKDETIRILVLSSTKNRCGIAEYTRQLFRPEFAQDVEIMVKEINPLNIFESPWSGANILHIQHEYFLFDRLVGLSAMFWYPYLWMLSKLIGFKIVTTFHSTYDVDNLAESLPHFAKYKWLFPIGRLYMILHLRLVFFYSKKVVILSKVGMENMRNATGAHNLVYMHLGNYMPAVNIKSHSLEVTEEKLFVLFGFAYPVKGYEYAINALNQVIQAGHKAKLVIVSGESAVAGFPGGVKGATYLDNLKSIVNALGLCQDVKFTGYLEEDDPLLGHIFSNAFCFIFPYLKRNFAPSAAISTVLATGKPVLVSDIPTFHEYHDLITFKPQNVTDLADKMIKLMSDDELYDTAKWLTRMNAEKFSMKNIFSDHVAMYRNLLDKHPIIWGDWVQ